MTFFFKWFTLFCICCFNITFIHASEKKPIQITCQDTTFTLYPKEYTELPDIPSPFKTTDGKEIITAFNKKNNFTLIPVTIENGDPWIPDKDLWGKGNQLEINSTDFPTLAQTGLHSEIELDSLKSITGRSIDEINKLGAPGGLSRTGFFSENEDILSVLKGDNLLVKKLGLTHPQLAEPLFHVWNLLGIAGHEQILSFRYNNYTISLKAHRTKPGQLSLFADGFRGGSDIRLSRSLSLKEENFIKQNYSLLDSNQIIELKNKLTTLHTGELEAYYIKRYGFYEGHTEYRVDPIAIAWIFGLKSLQEIDKAFKGELYETLTRHFTKTKK